MNSILKLKNLSKKYHTKDKEILAIKNIDLDVKEGEFVCLVGSSGCGKSTLLNIISGLDNPSNGKIIFNVTNPRIGYMFQSDCLFPWLTIMDNCLLGLKIQNINTKDNQEYVKKLLRKYNLYEFKDNYPNSLSGGMKQRVALIRTLAIKPDILLLDEAFNALDYQSRLAVTEDVYKIIKEEKQTAIMVTHNLEEAITMADKIYILSKRPCIIKKVFDVNLVGNTPMEKKNDPKFYELHNLIWKELDINV